jgi:hypothetical protein
MAGRQEADYRILANPLLFHSDLQFQPKFGPLGWIIGKTVMASQFRKVLTRVLDGLDEYIRTGKPVGQAGV